MYNIKTFKIKKKSRYSIEDSGTDRQTESILKCTPEIYKTSCQIVSETTYKI